MYRSGFTIGPILVNTGTGSQTINTLLDPFDLAGYSQCRATLSVYKAITDALDTLDIYIQSLAHNAVTWNDRGHFAQITGADDPDVTLPEVRHLNIQARIPIEATEEAYESTGSEGGTRLPAGTVRNGAFPDKLYSGGLWVPNLRIQTVVVDADADADFEASIWLEWS